MEQWESETKTGHDTCEEGLPPNLPKHHKITLKTRQENMVLRMKRTLKAARRRGWVRSEGPREEGMAGQ